MSVMTQSACPLAVDFAVKDYKDVVLYLNSYTDHVKTVKVEGEKIVGPETVFALVPTAADIRAAKASGQLLDWSYSIGPITIKASIDLSTLTASIVVTLQVPIIGTVTLASVTGSLTTGIIINLGWGGVLSGTLKFQIVNGDVTMFYDFEAFGNHFSGQVVLFHV